MKHLQLVNRTRKTLLGSRVMMADGWWGRTRGYLGRPKPRPGEGILLAPCRMVHMWGMRFPLDLVFLDQDGRVVRLVRGLQPGERSEFVREASYTLELPVGTIDASGTKVGDQMAWTPAARGGVDVDRADAAGSGLDELRVAPDWKVS